MRARSLLPLSGLAFSLKKNDDFKGSVFCTTGTCLFIDIDQPSIAIIDRDKQEKKEAESNSTGRQG